MRTKLLSASLLLLCSSIALGQELEPRSVKPVPIDAGPMGGNGHAETWDGRVFIVTKNYNNGSDVGWVDHVLRPGAPHRVPDRRRVVEPGHVADPHGVACPELESIEVLERAGQSGPPVARRYAIQRPIVHPDAA